MRSRGGGEFVSNPATSDTWIGRDVNGPGRRICRFTSLQLEWDRGSGSDDIAAPSIDPEGSAFRGRVFVEEPPDKVFVRSKMMFANIRAMNRR